EAARHGVAVARRRGGGDERGAAEPGGPLPDHGALDGGADRLRRRRQGSAGGGPPRLSRSLRRSASSSSESGLGPPKTSARVLPVCVSTHSSTRRTPSGTSQRATGTA